MKLKGPKNLFPGLDMTPLEARIRELERQVSILARKAGIDMEAEWELSEVLDYTARTLDGSRLYSYLERTNRKEGDNNGDKTSEKDAGQAQKG